MLESVGKLADRQCQQQQASYQLGSSDPHIQSAQQDHPQEVQKHEEFNTNLYFEHLKELSTKVSNRVRFLILNLIDLKDVRFFAFFTQQHYESCLSLFNKLLTDGAYHDNELPVFISLYEDTSREKSFLFSE